MEDKINQMLDNLKFIAEQESASITLTQDGCKLLYDYIMSLCEYTPEKGFRLVSDKYE